MLRRHNYQPRRVSLRLRAKQLLEAKRARASLARAAGVQAARNDRPRAAREGIVIARVTHGWGERLRSEAPRARSHSSPKPETPEESRTLCVLQTRVLYVCLYVWMQRKSRKADASVHVIRVPTDGWRQSSHCGAAIVAAATRKKKALSSVIT